MGPIKKNLRDRKRKDPNFKLPKKVTPGGTEDVEKTPQRSLRQTPARQSRKKITQYEKQMEQVETPESTKMDLGPTEIQSDQMVVPPNIQEAILAQSIDKITLTETKTDTTTQVQELQPIQVKEEQPSTSKAQETSVPLENRPQFVQRLMKHRQLPKMDKKKASEKLEKIRKVMMKTYKVPSRLQTPTKGNKHMLGTKDIIDHATQPYKAKKPEETIVKEDIAQDITDDPIPISAVERKKNFEKLIEMYNKLPSSDPEQPSTSTYINPFFHDDQSQKMLSRSNSPVPPKKRYFLNSIRHCSKSIYDSSDQYYLRPLDADNYFNKPGDRARANETVTLKNLVPLDFIANVEKKIKDLYYDEKLTNIKKVNTQTEILNKYKNYEYVNPKLKDNVPGPYPAHAQYSRTRAPYHPNDSDTSYEDE